MSQPAKDEMELQHVNVKLLARDANGVNLEPLIPIFHSWIQDRVLDEMLLDIADYRHVHHGPGVVLIGLEADYSVDNTDGLLGVRYNRKSPLEGSNAARLEQAARAAVLAFQRLEAESRLDGTLRFGGQQMQLFVNDRLLAPNENGTREALRSELNAFCQKLFRGSEYSLSFETDPRKLFGASVNVARSFPLEALLTNLEA